MKSSVALSIVLGTSLAVLAACSDAGTTSQAPGTTTPGTETPEDPGPQDPGLTPGGGASSAPDVNPDGVPYPTDVAFGTTPGTIIRNYKFLGYKDGDPAKGLVPVSLADYFDPTGKKVKLLHIQASGVWCTFCKQESRSVAAAIAELQARGIVWITSISETSTRGTASTQADLDRWIRDFKIPFPHVLDPANAQLGSFYDAAAMPWNADIDPRTMKILESSVGAGGKTTKDELLATMDAVLKKVQ